MMRCISRSLASSIGEFRLADSPSEFVSLVSILQFFILLKKVKKIMKRSEKFQAEVDQTTENLWYYQDLISSIINKQSEECCKFKARVSEVY